MPSAILEYGGHSLRDYARLLENCPALTEKQARELTDKFNREMVDLVAGYGPKAGSELGSG